VVDDDKRREIDDVDLPYRLHPELGILEDIDLLDAVLRKACGRAADGPEIEAAMFLAGFGDRPRAVALREHDHAPSRRLQGVNVGIHTSGRRGAKRPRGAPFRRLRRTRVVDREFAYVLGQAVAVVEALLDLRVSDVTRHDHGACEGETRLDRVAREL